MVLLGIISIEIALYCPIILFTLKIQHKISTSYLIYLVQIYKKKLPNIFTFTKLQIMRFRSFFYLILLIT